MRSKLTNSPLKLASLSVQIAFIASILSAISRIRVRGSVPWFRISSRFQPAPTPNSNRPPERWSIDATSFAGRDRAALDHEADAAADSQRGGRGRRGGQRYEQVVGVDVLARQLAA